MMNRTSPLLLATFAIGSAMISSARAQQGTLAVTSAFPGGSAETVSIDPAAHTIHIRPALHMGRGWPCWWYCRIDGAEAGKEIAVTVSGNPGPFRPGGAALAANWAQPIRAAISTDDAEWKQTPDAAFDAAQKTATYRFPAPAARFWIAWGPPYLPDRATEILKQTAALHPGGDVFTLATSRGGRPVSGIRLGPADAPQAIWVQARQHAWESGSSWVAQGFLEWIAGDDPSAKALRDTSEIFFVPIMDVDNVSDGAGGKEAVPRDHNRDWAEQPHYPEVAAAQARLTALDQAGRLRLYIDLHNPGPGDKQPFFFGPFDYEEMTAPARTNYDRWIALAGAEMTGPLPLTKAYKFATYVTTGEERGRMSTGWVRNHTAAGRVVAVTLETSWNTRESTTAGYRDTGARLGRTAARFLRP